MRKGWPLAALTVLLAWSRSAAAQLPTYGVGRSPTPREIAAWDIAVGPKGAELPAGRGTPGQGRKVYETQCAACHGPTGREGPQDVLVGGRGTLATSAPLRTVGSYWPHATTVFDYVRRAMPFQAPGSLTADEVYAVTAFLLHANGIIAADEVIDARTLPRVRMPNRDGFVRDPRPDAR